MTLEPDLIKLFCCPKCKGELLTGKGQKEFICKECELRFTNEDGIPNFLISEAQPWSEENPT